jgi:hypoxanthine phosphoribosyltransferase
VSRPRLKKVISSQKIARRVRALGREIGQSLSPDERPLAVVVLQGAFVFAADRVMLLQDLDSELDLRGRTILLIDDILDSGLTLGFLVAHLKARGAERIRVCVLLRRKQRKRSPAPAVDADFAGFLVGDGFFVGYGLDHAGRHRNLPDLAVLVER